MHPYIHQCHALLHPQVCTTTFPFTSFLDSYTHLSLHALLPQRTHIQTHTHSFTSSMRPRTFTLRNSHTYPHSTIYCIHASIYSPTHIEIHPDFHSSHPLSQTLIPPKHTFIYQSFCHSHLFSLTEVTLKFISLCNPSPATSYKKNSFPAHLHNPHTRNTAKLFQDPRCNEG